jgi:Tol biopolymer transport system component/DNA-binding winged helix-turn-helix (wHTH) protein
MLHAHEMVWTVCNATFTWIEYHHGMGDNWILHNTAFSKELHPEPPEIQRNSKGLQSPIQDEVYIFGEYRLDDRERRLWWEDESIPLPPKAFDLLHVLLKQAGQLVEKDYLLKTVWPDSFVEEANISVYISAIRKVFAKHSPNCEFIETIPKWGYRFTASVTRTPAAPSEEMQTAEAAATTSQVVLHEPAPVNLAVSESFSASLRSRLIRWFLLPLLSAVVVLATVLAIVKFPRKVNGITANTRPLIALPGFFSQPAFSADGQRIAYAWRSDSDPYQSIYIQGVSTDDRMRVTDTGGDDFSPAWSPKNPEIAFLHDVGEELEIAIVNTQTPALKRRLTSIAGVATTFRIPPSLAWSRDGRTLLTTDLEKKGDSPSLTLISANTGAKQRLTHAPLHMVDDDGVFSPDGSLIAFRREMGDSSDVVYVIAASGGQERRLAFEPGPIDGLAWSPDGKSILLSSGRATSVGNIWRIPVDGGSAVAVTTPLAHISTPVVSAAAHRLAYINSPNNVSIWRQPLLASGEAERFISSNFFDSSARYSPNGQFIAFRSDRSGANEIWVCHSDGKEPRRVTNFNGPMTGSPQWSPDSRSLAFDSRGSGRADIYVVSLAGGAPTRITNGVATNSDNVVPNWSRDGRSIYFTSNRTGDWKIWRKSLDGPGETQITTIGGFNGVESSDGAALYFVHDLGKADIWRLSLRSGKSEPVLQTLEPGMWGAWTVERDKLYYMKRRRSIGEPADIFRMDLVSGATETLGKVQNVVNGGISISPDGRWMLFAQNNSSRSSTIMIMDGWD